MTTILKPSTYRLADEIIPEVQGYSPNRVTGSTMTAIWPGPERLKSADQLRGYKQRSNAPFNTIFVNDLNNRKQTSALMRGIFALERRQFCLNGFPACGHAWSKTMMAIGTV